MTDEERTERIRDNKKRYYQRVCEDPVRKAKMFLRLQCNRQGITPEEYESRLREQNGVCAICKQPEAVVSYSGTIMLSIDHDHQTGRIRGLLCNRCNRMIGLANDSVERLMDAVEYLQNEQSDFV